jgi:hypothetical protein
MVFIAAFSDASAAAASKDRLEKEPETTLDGILADWQERRIINSQLPGLRAVYLYFTAGLQTDPPQVPSSQQGNDEGLGTIGLIGIVSGSVVALGLVIVGVAISHRARRDRYDAQETDQRTSSTLPEPVRRELTGDVVKAIARAQRDVNESRSPRGGGHGDAGRPEEDPDLALMRQDHMRDRQARPSKSKRGEVDSDALTEYGSGGSLGPEDVPLDLEGDMHEITLAMLDHTAHHRADIKDDDPNPAMSDGGGKVDLKIEEFGTFERPGVTHL